MNIHYIGRVVFCQGLRPDLKSNKLLSKKSAAPRAGWIGLPHRPIAAAAGCRLPENHVSSFGLEPEEPQETLDQ